MTISKFDLDALEQKVTETKRILTSDRLDMSFGEIISMYQENEIIISPEFQRLFRWSNYQKTRFIESILLGIPIPPIFVSETNEGKWELIDGLQRLSTVLSFFGVLKVNNTNLDDKEKNNWVMEKGDLIDLLEGKSKNELPLKLQLSIKRAVCRVELLHYNNENMYLKYELFNRLNTGGSKATEQEIRNCIFRGIDNKFNNLLKDLSQNQNLKELVMASQEEIEQLFLEELPLRFLSLYYIDDSSYTNNRLDITENISKYMTNFMELAIKKQNFNYSDAEDVFNRLFNLLSKLDDPLLFRASKGPFSTNIFDLITIGVSSYLDYYENNIDILKSKIQKFKEEAIYKQTTSDKISSKQRNTKRLTLAKDFFNPHN